MLLAGHGLPIFGADRVRAALTDTAELLESLEAQTLTLMNTGCTLDRVIHEVEVPAHLRDKPYLRPVYDHPQFIVRNVWRRYGGWYDGEPDNLAARRRAPSRRAEWVDTRGWRREGPRPRSGARRGRRSAPRLPSRRARGDRRTRCRTRCTRLEPTSTRHERCSRSRRWRATSCAMPPKRASRASETWQVTGERSDPPRHRRRRRSRDDRCATDERDDDPAVPRARAARGGGRSE